MKIGGHDLRDHFRLLAPSFGLITAVWLLRLVLDEVGAPHGVVRAFSVLVASAVAVLLAVLLMHAKRFGSYPNVAAAAFLLVFWAQLVIASAIAFAALTGTRNIYTAPEYSFGASHWRHIAGHLTFGVGEGTLLGTAMGSLLLWLLRFLVPAAPAK